MARAVGSETAMASPKANIQTPPPVILSPEESSLDGCNFVSPAAESAATALNLLTTPPSRIFATVSESILLDKPSFSYPPSSGSSANNSLPQPSSSITRQVLLQELVASQDDIENVVSDTDDDFFLLPPKQVFSIQEDPSPVVVIRPRAHRSRVGDDDDDEQEEEPSLVTTIAPSSDFAPILQDEASTALRRATTPHVSLKPRPASLRDGQRAWESMSTFTTSSLLFSVQDEA